ncbi:MAG: hypothetical protein M3Z33_05095 [Actinomycetota bacterium]|nr:hypothetical protein [Actinomycetota bacterium]
MSHSSRELGARTICITFAPPSLLAAFEREMGLEIPLYGDPHRAVYTVFGFERGSVARVWLDPRVWRRYAKLLARGRRFRRVQQDTLQLGGDAVFDSEGRLRWIYRSAGPEDRPTVAELIAAIHDS